MAEININLTESGGQEIDIGAISTEGVAVSVGIENPQAEMGVTLSSTPQTLTVGLDAQEDEITTAILTAANEAANAEQARQEAQQAALDAQEYALRTSAAVNNINNNLGDIEDAVIALRSRVNALENNADSYITDGEVINAVGYFYNNTGDTRFTMEGMGGGGGSGGGDDVTSTVTMSNTTGWASTTTTSGVDVILSFTWSSIEDGLETGEGTLTVSANGSIKETRNLQQGAFTVNVKDYLVTGDNSVVVSVTDSYGKRKWKTFSISVVELYITSTFDPGDVQSGVLNFSYTPYGGVTKTIHFELDGTDLETVTSSSSGRQMSYVISQQAHGAHVLRVWFTATVNGQSVTSNVLYYDIMWVIPGNTTPIISSSYDRNIVDQYSTITIPFMVYTPGSQVSRVTVQVDGITTATMTDVGREMNSLTMRMDTDGNHTVSLVSGTARKNIGIQVNSVSIDAEAETENLRLYLSSTGRSNLENNPGTWTYGTGNDMVETTMTGFNWVSNGWVADNDGVTALRVNGGARAVIGYKPFDHDLRQTGGTIEFEFAARDVRDYEAVLIDCMSGGRGFQLTAQDCRVAGEQSSIDIEYKEDEHIRVSFVYGQRSGTRLLMCYVNGIVSAAVQYPESDNFEQSTPVNITIGNNDCTTDVYVIRAYDMALNSQQIEDNWIADTQDGPTMLDRYGRNNIRDAYGNIEISKLPSDLCYMTLIGDELPAFKGDKKKISGSFVNPLNPDKNFSFTDADIDVQGTSSQYYVVKNFKMKFKTGFINRNGTVVGTYQIRDDSIPVNTFTMKADVASSEGANNTVLAIEFNEDNPYQTPAQEEDSRVRQGIDGFPMVMFWNNTAQNVIGFVGKYNFNNDKATEAVFGFVSGDESWEFRNNTSDRSLFISADFDSMGVDENGDPIKDWLNDFEARYPDTDPVYTDKTQMEAFCKWVVSTNTDAATGNALSESVTWDGITYTSDTAAYRLAKFRNELPLFAEVESFTFYYIFTYAMLLMDNRAKNMFLTFVGDEITVEDIAAHPELAGMRKKATLPAYDFDSGLGINNEGKLVYPYYLEDIDQWDEADVYNGQRSVLWINFRNTYWPEIRIMWQTLRANGIMSSSKTITAFRTHQHKWPEAVFNEDAYYKYLRPVDSGDTSYLGMLLGSKETQREGFLYKRFRYIDSQMFAGDALRETVVVRGYAKANITLTPFEKTYLHIRYGSYDVTARAINSGSYEMLNPMDNVNDTEIIVYLAGAIRDFGDLSGLKIGYGAFANATKAVRLQIGSNAAGYDNPNLKELSIGNLKLLQVLDLRNVSGLGTGDQKSVDLSGCTDIREVYCDGTNLTGLSLPNGGFLSKLHLPGTIANLTLRNQSALTEFVCPDYSHITTLWLDNPASVIDTMAIVSDMPTGGRVRLFNFHWELEDLSDVGEMFDKLDTMSGLDQNGNNTGSAQAYGSIHVVTAQGNVLAHMAARYPDVTITYDHITANQYYYSWDGETLLHTETLTDDETPAWAGSPSRTETAQYTFTFAGWALTQDASEADAAATTALTADRSVYAAYSRVVKNYTVTFVRDSIDGGGTLETKQVAYGSTPIYTGATPTSSNSDGGVYVFTGWSPELGPITGATTYTAVFRDNAVSVTYMNGETEFATEKLTYGQNASGPSSNPTKASTVSTDYTFAGWSLADDGTVDAGILNNITESKTVYAVFTETVRKYTITFVKASADGGGTLESKQVAYGTMPTYTGATPASTQGEEYSFNGWSPDLAVVTGAATYTAVFMDNSGPIYTYLKRTMTAYESDTATTIGQNAFYNMSSLTSVETTATTIGKYAFAGCSNLETVDLKETSGTVSIGTGAFSGCSNLTALIIRSSSVAAMESTTALPIENFSVAGGGAIYVPAELVASYKAATNWSTFADRIYPISAYPVTNIDTISDTVEQMGAKLQAGTADYNVGDIKTIDMGTEGTVKLVVIAKNTDVLASGSGNAPYTFWAVKIPSTSHRMNPALDGTTEGTGSIGGWEKCEMRTYLRETLLPMLPEALRNAIKPVTKYSYGYNTSGEKVANMETTETIFLLSDREVNNSSTYETQGVTYSGYFTSSTRKIACNQNDSANYWWLRSADGTSSWRRLNSRGDGTSNVSASSTNGVAFGFCA